MNNQKPVKHNNSLFNNTTFSCFLVLFENPLDWKNSTEKEQKEIINNIHHKAKIDYVNKEFENIYKIRKQNVIGKNLLNSGLENNLSENIIKELFEDGYTYNKELKKNFINEEMFLKNIRFCIYNKIGITGYYIAESPLEFVKPGMLIRSDFDAFDSILNASPNLFIFLDKHGIIINTNITYFKNVFYCKENDNVLSKPLAEYFSNDIGEHNKYLYEKTIEDKVKNSFEMKINGKIFEVIIYPILENNQNVQFIVCSLNDITKKIESEKKILTYLEKERQQIGQELHDELGQYLTGISLLMESLRKKIKEENSPYLEKIETISGLIVQSINFTHNLAKGLRTVTKEGDELVLEIELLCDDIKRKFDINCIFNNKLTVEILNTQISTQIYYIAKEALNNAVKHSKPDYILVEISSDKDFVWLRVENNGVSDNKEKIRQGLGREIMSYRAKIIGANFSILKIGNNFRVEVKSLNRL